ncbi:hypothetical protein TRFO_26721 [Tritrichomonas foetus]|uniref:Uncharacterized protein n=1 Tax=Tritrichomonas foetus TaxID=1144522 RepID=A0A1J4K7W7_9EUKA|nr:hypothetical protein TRFO_26721 [Tritrichomonas foetus]|eukprot:OHT05517.1 hypothetical protein TRFO_26721 [Tritrichomonas foetus]
MTKILTQTNEIQAHLEDLMKKEEARAAQLKQRLDELNQQLNSQNVNAGSITEVKFGDNVKVRIGTSKFDKLIRSNCTYDDFIQPARVSIGTDKVGFRDDQGRIVWIRTNQDIHFMFTWYFAQELPFIPVVAVPPNDVATISKLNLRKEFTFKEGCAAFRCECAGPDGPLIFLAVPPNSTKDDGFAYLQSLFGNFSSLMFVDEAEDIITIDSDESWEYCIETGMAMAKVGKFPLLLVGMSS